MLNWNWDNRWSRTSFSYSSKIACKFLSFAHFLKTFLHHSVFFFVLSFSLLSSNSSIYSSITISNETPLLQKNNFSIEWAVARRPEDQSRASNFALFCICGSLKGLHLTDIMCKFPQVIANALGKLRINFLCIFKVFPKIALIALRLRQVWKNFENIHEINP